MFPQEGWGNPVNIEKDKVYIQTLKGFLKQTVVHQKTLIFNLNKLMRLTEVFHWIKYKLPKLEIC